MYIEMVSHLTSAVEAEAYAGAALPAAPHVAGSSSLFQYLVDGDGSTLALSYLLGKLQGLLSLCFSNHKGLLLCFIKMRMGR
jgi:hypothetical protein